MHAMTKNAVTRTVQIKLEVTTNVVQGLMTELTVKNTIKTPTLKRGEGCIVEFSEEKVRCTR
jgi:hypothetical protein